MSRKKTSMRTIKFQPEYLEEFEDTVRALLEDQRKTIPYEFFSQALKIFVRVQTEKIDKQVNQVIEMREKADEEVDHSILEASFQDKVKFVRSYYKEILS